MIRHAVSGIVLAFACSACVPPPGSGAAQPRVFFAAAACPGKASFADSVQFLNAKFYPQRVGGAYNPPSADPLDQSAYPNIATDLNNAFSMASPPFQTLLCSLSGIYVDPYLDASWGMRENAQNQSTLQNRYIGLSLKALWPGLNPAPLFTYYENGIVAQLTTGQLASAPQYISSDQNTSAATVLGVLAHEMGHIRWWQNNIIGTACTKSPLPAGMKPYFVKYSWQRIAQTPQFHFFGVRTHPNPSTGLGGNVAYVRPDIDELLFDVNHNSAGVNDDLDRIFSGEWASMFATVSPDEDFIETYKLSVLASAQTPLGSLVVSLPSGQSVDIIKDLFINSGTTLYKKAQWITAPCF